MTESPPRRPLHDLRNQLDRLKKRTGSPLLTSIRPSELAELERTLDELSEQLAAIERSSISPQALNASEARLRQIIDLVPHMVFAKDRNGRFLLANKAVASAYGLEPCELVGRTHSELHANQAELTRMLSDDREVIESGNPKFIAQEEFTDHRGRRIVLQTTKIPFTESGSNEPAMLGVAIDITARVEAERALVRAHRELEQRVIERTSRLAATNKRLQEEIDDHQRTTEAYGRHKLRARAFLDVVPDMIFRLNTSGVFLDFRTDARDDLLVAPETIIGRNISTLPMPEEVKKGLMQTMLRAIETGELLEYEYDLEIEGRTASFEARFVKSGPDESICFVRNITDRKRAQERIRQHQAELAHVARVSTMGEMAAGLAHEVNQPLSAIGNYAAACSERLRTMETEEAEELKEWVAEIENEAMRAGEIIRRLRYLVSKRRADRTTLDLTLLIKEVISLVTPEARSLGVRTELEMSRHLPGVEGDPVQIQQVLLNLMRNGLEAMQDTPESGRVLAVCCQPVGSAELAAGRKSKVDWLEVTIADRGTGIPLEATERVFDPFFTTKAEGMGMGLPISRSIIEAHGGRLEVRPGPDQGTISRFTLPVFSESEPEKKGAPPSRGVTATRPESVPPVRNRRA